MELQTISQVTKGYGVSPRMLRYYEGVELIQSSRREGYAYRVYDEDNLTRLRQIIVLRKLRVPVKQIVSILSNTGAAETVEIFRQNISKMEDLNHANHRLDQYEDKDVRIVCLPPMTVAAAVADGQDCEGIAGAMIRGFVTDTGLLERKPDTRSFGFDCSEGATGVGEPSRVYELWVSVPEDMEIPSPLIRREFRSGMYAAHVLTGWDFSDWRLLLLTEEQRLSLWERNGGCRMGRRHDDALAFRAEHAGKTIDVDPADGGKSPYSFTFEVVDCRD